jgi:hypothetical protein
MTEKAVFLAEEQPNKFNSHYKKYNHLACGIEIDGKPHTVHIILGENQGQWYYSHILLDIEKGSLLAGIQQPKPGHPIRTSLSDIKDTTLLRLLQADSSKIIDENGEPHPVFHGTNQQFDIFDISKARQNADIPAFFFSKNNTEASEYGDVNSCFLNIRNAKIDKPVVNMQGLAIRKELVKQGFDGMITDEDGIVEYAAFYPNQIKSATKNTGTYNRADLSVTDSRSKRAISNEKHKELSMQIPISTQSDYDKIVKGGQHMGNEIVIQNTADTITVHTNVTVGRNGRCKTDGKSSAAITAKENGVVIADGKTTVIGYGNANIIAKGNCKITLHDSSFGNCYEHCHITLKGASKISADGNCTVHAYDETAVSASGSSKVHTYQKATAKGTDVTALSGKGESTLYGQKNCSIMAKDNCIVYASDNCTVQAADNCLVVANKYATIKASDNCLIMSNENPNDNITLFDKCEHLKLEDVNDKNIMSALKQMAQSKAVVERPYVAIQILKDNIPQTRREAVNRRLNTMGLKDQTAAKNYLYSLIEAEPAQKNQAPAKNLERQLETARKAGYVQGVCECVAVVGNEQNMGKKLLSEMQVTKDMAKKFANPETFKTLEQGIFAQKQEQKLEQTHSRKL